VCTGLDDLKTQPSGQVYFNLSIFMYGAIFHITQFQISEKSRELALRSVAQSLWR